MEDTKTVADLIEINLTISALLRETNCQTLSEMAQELKANRQHIAEREHDLRDTTRQIEYERSQHVARLAELRDELNQALADGDLTQHKLDVANKHIAERDAKLEAIKAVMRRWIDSGARSDLNSGGGMLEILAILYPPPAPTGTKRED